MHVSKKLTPLGNGPSRPDPLRPSAVICCFHHPQHNDSSHFSKRYEPKREAGLSVMKRTKQLKSEDAERKFWSSHDSTDHIDWSKAKKMVFPNLRPSYKTISIRLSTSMIEELRLIAHKKDVPY